jgi:hypothetical protein
MKLVKTMLVIGLAFSMSMAMGCSIFQKEATPSQPAPAADSGSQGNVANSGAPAKASLGALL